MDKLRVPPLRPEEVPSAWAAVPTPRGEFLPPTESYDDLEEEARKHLESLERSASCHDEEAGK